MVVISCLMHMIASIALEINVGFWPIILLMLGLPPPFILIISPLSSHFAGLFSISSVYQTPCCSLFLDFFLPCLFHDWFLLIFLISVRITSLGPSMTTCLMKHLPLSHPATLNHLVCFVNSTSQSKFLPYVFFFTCLLTVSTTRVWTPWGQGS